MENFLYRNLRASPSFEQCHKQECYKEYAHLALPITEQIHRTELSLPIGPTMSEAEAQQVIEAINAFI